MDMDAQIKEAMAAELEDAIELETAAGPAPALVLEGGGFRGMFTAGVLDVLMERGLTGFSSVWGAVSYTHLTLPTN